MNYSSFTGEISAKVYEIYQEMRGGQPTGVARNFANTGKDKQRHLRQCCWMAQIVSNTTTRKLNMKLKNVNTVLNLNMADTRVEDIESDSDSSSFDNDDFSDDSDDNHYQKIATGIFGDSVKTMKFSRNFPSNCLKCKLDSQEDNLSGREQDDLYVHDQPRTYCKYGGKHSPNQYFFINFY